MPSPPELGDIRKICVMGWGLKGDLFIRIPIIEVLRQRFPQAEITVVVDPGNTNVLANHPVVDHVFPFARNKKPLHRYMFHTVRNALLLRRQRFDLSVDLYAGGSSPALILIVNARWRLGFDHTRALRMANNLLTQRPDMCRHWTRALAALLQPLGVDLAQVRLGTSYYCTESARRFAREFLAARPGARRVVFNLGTRAVSRRWPIENFVELGVLVNRRFNMIPLVFTNPGMEELTQRFSELYGRHGKCVCVPRLDMDREAAIMEQCEAVVTGNTALMHLASALKRPTLGLFIETRPEQVQPEDCPFVACYIEDPGQRDECGRPQTTAPLPVTYVFDCFVELVRTYAKPAPKV
ncbi:MAG: glycosyltransferase family 9 protein [Acidiferrobacterales bacterium]